jgi:hypothetical protein
MKNVLNFDDFAKINRLNLSFRELETYVLALLEIKLKKQKKHLVKYVKEQVNYPDGSNLYIEFDGVVTEGFDNLQGPTIVEFKRMFSKSSLDFLTRASNFYPKYKSILFIVGSTLSKDELDYFTEFTNKFPQDFKILIWDFNNIIELSNKYLTESSKIIHNLGDEILKSTVEKANKIHDWKEERNILVNSVNSSFKNDELVFFLGAGVSKDSGVPSWDELLRSLNISIIESKVPFKLSADQKEDIVKLLTELQKGSPLVSASYIRKALDDKFLNEIKKSLYSNLKPLNEQKLISTIAKAARPLIGKLGIRAIITYNFDDLLEQHLEVNSTDYKSIYKEGDFEIPTKRTIYHVHGFIPNNTEQYTDLDKSLLVFSEDGYHSLQNDPYSWSNLVQLKALRENTCVLIGLSGIDPNLRRLFSNFSKRFDACKHYILLQRQLNDINTTLSKEEFSKFSNLHHKIQEDVFKELGLKVIWYESHKEIPELVKRITTI